MATTAAISKEDLQRAGSILKDIIGDLERPQDLEDVLSEEERGSLHELRKMLDIMESPLLGAVADITDTCKKTVRESKQWNRAADVKTTTTSDDVITEFKRRYKISHNLLDDIDITLSQKEGGAPGDEPHQSTAGADLNGHCPQRTPSMSSTDSANSAGSRRKRGKRKKDRGMTLAHLARDSDNRSSGVDPSDGGIPLKSIPPGVSTANRDVSISSLSSDASPPPLPPSLPPLDDVFSNSPPPSPNRPEGLEVKGQQPKDLLFFMRDKKSMTDVRSTLNGRWGRDPRQIELPLLLTSPDDSMGFELCGLSLTGVFVSNVTSSLLEDRLQIGDQILEVDQGSVENMAWFEVEHLIRTKLHPLTVGANENKSGGSEDEYEETDRVRQKNTELDQQYTTISLVVQYNPAGLGEARRKKSSS